MVWDSILDIALQRYYELAKEYYEEHGDLNVPCDYKKINGIDLAAWIRRQRDLRAGGAKTGIPPTTGQIARLDEISMIWKNKFEVAWVVCFRYAQEYYIANRDLLVNPNYVCPGGYNLGGWISNQRANCKTTDKYRKLDKSQIKRLN